MGKRAVAFGVAAAFVVACRSDGTVRLKPGTAVVYERTLISSLAQIESLGVYDLARDGDDVVVLIRYGWVSFTEHPPIPSDPGGAATGGSATSAGYDLAISRDGGETFATLPLYAADGVSGEPLGVHLDAGRAWVVLASDGPVYSTPIRAHELDLDTGTLAAASPGQEFLFVNGGASSVSFAGDLMTMSVSDYRTSAVYGGSLGFQELDLSTGTFTDRTAALNSDCSTKLYPVDQGQAWEGYRDCLPAGQQAWCRFSTGISETLPTMECVPRVSWPGPWAEYEQAVTGAGVVQVYARDGHSYAAQLRGTQPVEIPLGEGDVATGGLRPGPLLRQAYGSLVPIGLPVSRLVALSSDGESFDVPIPSPCVEDDGCPAEITRVLSLGGDDYLTLYTATLDEGDLRQRTLLLRRDTVVETPVSADSDVAPVPGCPTAIAATAVVNECAIEAATNPSVEIRACIRDRTTTSPDPQCPTSTVCVGDLACVAGGSLDCEALGLPCSTTASSLYAHCEDDDDPTDTCPTQACAGQYMLVELGYEHAYVDCVALGFSTCAEEYAGWPRCVP